MLSQPRNKLNQQLCRQRGYISHTHLPYHLVQVQSYSHAPWSYIHTKPTLNFRCCFLRMLHTVLPSGRWGIHWDFILTNVFSGNTRSMVPHMRWFEGDWSLENMIQPYKKPLHFVSHWEPKNGWSLTLLIPRLHPERQRLNHILPGEVNSGCCKPK